MLETTASVSLIVETHQAGGLEIVEFESQDGGGRETERRGWGDV